MKNRLNGAREFRIKWLKKRDRNARFFHGMSSARKEQRKYLVLQFMRLD